MYKTAIEYYKEPVERSINYVPYKGHVQSKETFIHVKQPPTPDTPATPPVKNSEKITQLTWKAERYNNMADPNVWGPAFWFTLHNGASKYPVSASPITIERMKSFIFGIPVMLPCEKCQYHATNHIMMNKNKLNQICSGRDSLFTFFVDFHNIVNKRYNKPLMSVEQAYQIYNGGAMISKLSY
jgi:hypothetical protein